MGNIATKLRCGALVALVALTGIAAAAGVNYADPRNTGVLPEAKGGTNRTDGKVTALAADGSNCGGGQAAAGIDASGNAQGCFSPSGIGDTSSNTTTSVDGEAVEFSGNLGKTLKRSAKTGIIKETAGVKAVATPGTDYVLPGGNVATASALATNGANCPAGQYPLGVDASGAVEGCTAGSSTASGVSYTPGGSISATNAQDAIDEAAAESFKLGADNVVTGTNTYNKASICAPTAVAALDLDVTQCALTKSVSANSTFTFAATPASGTSFQLALTCTNSVPCTLTFPSFYDVARGITTTTLVAQGSSTVSRFFITRVGSAWHISGPTGYINNATAADPTPDDDLDLGYGPLSRWLNTSSNVTWTMESNANGAAVWNTPTSTVADGSITLAKMADLAANKFVCRSTGSTGVPQTCDITAAARGLLDDADAAAMRTTLGVSTGIDLTGVTFASLGTATAGTCKRVTNVGPAGFGSVWCANGSRWYPMNGLVRMCSVTTPATSTNSAETKLTGCALPAGVWQNNDKLIVKVTYSKSGTADTCNMRIRYGSTDDVAGTQITATASLATTNISGGYTYDIRRDSATSVIKMGSGSSTAPYGGTNTAAQAAFTVSDIDSSMTYMNVTAASTTTEACGAADFEIQLVSTVN